MADNIIFLYREDYYNRHDPSYEKDNIMECILSKNRDGELATIPFDWNGKMQKISNKTKK